MNDKIFAVIAAYNEEKEIASVIRGVKNHIVPEQIIVVDDGSKDNTKKTSLDEGATVLKNVINVGKGAALKTGCDYAIRQGASAIVVLDADNQHDPKEIPKFLEALKNNDIVFGVRKFNKNMPFVLKLGNTFIKHASRTLYGINLKDSQCGYRAFTAETYKKIRWTVSDYSLESEMVANVGVHKLKFAEVPIETIYSDKYKGTTVIDGIKIVGNLFMWRLRK